MRGPSKLVTLLAVAAAVLATTAACVSSQQAEETQAATPSPGIETLLPNGRQPFEGIFTGGQPTLVGLEEARDAGLRTVINLRPVTEPAVEGEAEWVVALGMRYVLIPVAGAEGMTEDNARALDRALAESERPIVVHCASGNRVGGLFALKSFYLDGEPAAKAMEIGLAAGLTGLEPVVRRLVESPAATHEEQRP